MPPCAEAASMIYQPATRPSCERYGSLVEQHFKQCELATWTALLP